MANERLKAIEKKWSDILDEGQTPIKNQKIRKSTALMLENEAKYLTGNDMDESTA
ncbi:MAG: hypothetical protein ACOCQD_01250 [archaeon]